MFTILIYTTDKTLLDEIDTNSDISDIVGEGWPDLPFTQREIVPDLVYEISLVVPNEADFCGIADCIDAMTGGACLIVQTV